MASTTARRKRKSTSRKRKAAVGTIKQGGITYKKKSCHKTKTAAKKAAKAIRARGYTATVRGNCVFQGRKRKK